MNYYASGLYYRIDRHHLFLMSAGVAFTVFVCIVPLLLIILYVLGNIVEQPEVIKDIHSLIDRFIPYPEFAQTMKAEITLRLKTLSDFNEIAGLIGVIGVIFMGSTLFSSIRTVLNKIFHPHKTEKFLIEKMYDFVLIVIVLMLFLCYTFILPTISTLADIAGSIEWLEKIGLGTLEHYFFQIISIVIIFIMFFIVFWLIPLSRTRLKIVYISSLIATLLWQVAELVFGYYINHVVTLQHIYGMYAFLAISGFWIYYAVFSMFVAAEFGQLYFERWEKIKAARQSTFFDEELEPK